MGHTLVTLHVMTWDVDEPYLNNSKNVIAVAYSCTFSLENEASSTLQWDISSARVRNELCKNLLLTYPSASLVNVAQRELLEVIFWADKKLC